jgi:nitrogen fixation NifU-like protein
MSDLRDLYQEVILDHSKRPRNFRAVEEPVRKVRGYNPLCGDNITIFLKLEDGVLRDVAFQGSGCAICTASASVMTETTRGKTETDVEALFESFHELVTGKREPGDDPAKLGKLAVFAGVSEFPMRVKCASLPWHTLHAAIKEEGDTVSTE